MQKGTFSIVHRLPGISLSRKGKGKPLAKITTVSAKFNYLQLLPGLSSTGFWGVYLAALFLFLLVSSSEIRLLT